MIDGQVDSNTPINFPYDNVIRHFHVITNLTGAMAQRYICNWCNNGCKRGVTHKCDVSCSELRPSPHVYPTQIAELHVTTVRDISEVERILIIIK
jgi:hypothetical protein